MTIRRRVRHPLLARVRLLIVGGVIALLLMAGPALARSTARRATAQPAGGLSVTAVDTTAFPTVRLTVSDDGGADAAALDWSTTVVQENGRAVRDVVVTDLRRPLDVAFVLDANPTINQIDDAGEPSRLEKARQAMLTFVRQTMGQRDSLAVVVPAGDQPRFLVQGDDESIQIQDAVEAYRADAPQTTPLNAMLAAAIDALNTPDADGRSRVLLLFTDGALLNSQLDFDALVAQAQAADVRLYAAILGARADDNEIANVSALTAPTGGQFVHLTAAPAVAPVIDAWRDDALVREIRYRAVAAGNAPRQVSVAVSGQEASANYHVDVAPPAIAFDPATARRLVLDDFGPPPRLVELTARLSWPDGFPRRLATAELLVDGRPQERATQPVVSGETLALIWDVSALPPGVYALTIGVTDELGLVANSESIIIEMAGVEAAPPPATEPLLTPVPLETLAPAPDAPLPLAGQPWFWPLVVAGGALLLTALLLLLWRRRRGDRPGAAAPVAVDGPPGADQAAAPVVAAPLAYLAVIANAPALPPVIAIATDNFIIGRDPRRATVVLDDAQVAEAHARIMHDGGLFQLVDEGSEFGTYRNFNRLGLAPQPLADGDDIHVGRAHFRFHLRRPPDVVAPSAPKETL